MKKFISLLLVSTLTLSLCACGSTNDSSSDDVNQISPDTTIIENVKTEKEEIIEDNRNIEQELEIVEPEITSLEYGDLVINIPKNIMDLVTIEEGTSSDNPHMTNLFDISETASIEAGQKMHPGEDWGDGWLFGISVVDQIGFEELVGIDIPGYTILAQNDDKYYIYTHPTDVRLMRENNDYSVGMEEWTMLCEWADSMKDTIIKDNDLLPVSILDMDYTYDSEHKYFEYKDEWAHNIIILSQPVQQGENGIWCVERIEEYYNGELMYKRFIFPIAMGIQKTAHQYYVELQEKVDNRENLESLHPEKVLENFLNSAAWYYGPTNVSDLIEIER